MSAPAGFPLFVRYLPSGLRYIDLAEMISRHATFHHVWHFRQDGEYYNPRGNLRALVIFNDEAERQKAWEGLQTSYLGTEQDGQPMFWLADPATISLIRADWLTWETPPPTDAQKLWLESRFEMIEITCFRPGSMAMLPPWGCQNPIYYVDPRIDKTLYNHPVIILRKKADYLYDIVICRTFRGKPPEEEFPDRPDLHYRYLKIEHDDSPPDDSDHTLKLAFGRYMASQTYAGTTVYTVEIGALAKLWNLRLSAMRVKNLEVLEERIKAVEDYYELGDPRGHPSWRGGVIIPEPRITATAPS